MIIIMNKYDNNMITIGYQKSRKLLNVQSIKDKKLKEQFILIIICFAIFQWKFDTYIINIVMYFRILGPIFKLPPFHYETFACRMTIFH